MKYGGVDHGGAKYTSGHYGWHDRNSSLSSFKTESARVLLPLETHTFLHICYVKHARAEFRDVDAVKKQNDFTE